MLTRFSAVASVALLVSQAPSAVEAHGELVLPKPTYAQWGGNVCATIAPSKLPFTFDFKGKFTDAFDAAFLKNGQSLKDFILKNQDTSGASVPGSTAECGYSNPNGTPQPLPDKINFNNGFIHQGPCEAYCDDVLVTEHSPDCRSLYAGGIVPYDKAKCAGKKRFTFYWLSMDSGNGAPWQVYINCVPLSGSSGGSSGSSGANSSNSTTPAATTAAPDASAPEASDPSPSPATAKPATSAPAPAATSKKPANCARRQRRD